MELSWHDRQNLMSLVNMIYTHGVILLPTLLVKYYNDNLDIQGCGRGGGWVTCFKVGDVFSYVLDITYANSRQKISSDMTCGMSWKKITTSIEVKIAIKTLRHSPARVQWDFLPRIGIRNVKDIRKNVPNFEACDPTPTPPTTQYI